MNYAWSFVFFVMAVAMFLISNLYHHISLKRDYLYLSASIGKWVLLACAFIMAAMSYVSWTMPDPSSITYTNGTEVSP